MNNRSNFLTYGLLFLILGNLTESWIKYVNFTLGTIFILGSSAQKKEFKDEK